MPTVLLPSSVMVRLAFSVRQKFASAPVPSGTPPFQFSGWLQLNGITVPFTLIALSESHCGFSLRSVSRER
jgi:hypothetical protein